MKITKTTKMITLTTSLRETLKAQDIIRDLNIACIFDIQEEQVASNCWTFTTFEEDMEDICLDIENMLSKSGLVEFEISFNN